MKDTFGETDNGRSLANPRRAGIRNKVDNVQRTTYARTTSGSLFIISVIKIESIFALCEGLCLSRQSPARISHALADVIIDRETTRERTVITLAII